MAFEVMCEGCCCCPCYLSSNCGVTSCTRMPCPCLILDLEEAEIKIFVAYKRVRVSPPFFFIFLSLSFSFLLFLLSSSFLTTSSSTDKANFCTFRPSIDLFLFSYPSCLSSSIFKQLSLLSHAHRNHFYVCRCCFCPCPCYRLFVVQEEDPCGRRQAYLPRRRTQTQVHCLSVFVFFVVSKRQQQRKRLLLQPSR